MRNDFCVFILTHARPDAQKTIELLAKNGYTGKTFLVVDDEDASLGRYLELYGDRVLVFSKEEVVKTFDIADNFKIKKSITYARNVTWELARKVGCKYFVQFDDDYDLIGMRLDSSGRYGFWHARDLDAIFDAMIEYFETIPALSIAMSQGGDHMGGRHAKFGQGNQTSRKAMNSFLCSVDRPFKFRGSINQDVSTYTTLGRRGELFLTIGRLFLNQGTTQQNPGGITDTYLRLGTYQKSMYSVMHCPSSVSVRPMGKTMPRIHHSVRWNSTAVKIVHERYRKPDSVEEVSG